MTLRRNRWVGEVCDIIYYNEAKTRKKLVTKQRPW